MIGTVTNVVTAAEVTGRRSADSPHLPALLKTTTKRFKAKTVAADKGYISHSNLDAIACAGAFPLIPFKSHHNPGGGYWSKRSNSRVSQGSRELWRKMYEFFTYNREEFLAHYPRRPLQTVPGVATSKCTSPSVVKFVVT
jgi:hypothetical protein